MTQRCKHLDDIRDELERAGATAISVQRHGPVLQIAWVLKGRPCHMEVPVHPRDEVNAGNVGRQRARRVCREVRVS